MFVKVAEGKDLGKAKTIGYEWSDLAKKLTTHTKTLRKRGGAFIVGGYFNTDDDRNTDNMVARTMLTVDCDNVQMSMEEIEFHLSCVIDCSYVAYSTFSHTADTPRIRIVAPLSREVTPDEYRLVAAEFIESLEIPCDECSVKPNQVMYLPACADLTTAWCYREDEGGAYPVSDEPLCEVAAVNDESGDESGGLEALVASEPLDITDEAVDHYLISYPAEQCGYDEWVKVGMGVYHQTQGSAEGLQKWSDWSSKDADRYDEREVSRKWKSFGGSSNPTTFATVIHKAKEAQPDLFEKCLADAKLVTDLGSFEKFKAGLIPLEVEQVGVLVKQLHADWGKDAGISKLDLKASVKKTLVADNKSQSSDWVNEWCFLEVPGVFYNTTTHYECSTASFNMTHSGRPAVKIAEMCASHYVTVHLKTKIRFFVDRMFWPGAGESFDFEGKRMLNSYKEQGVEADGDDPDVIARFLKHLEWTLPDPVEREIFFDWLCFVCQHPGKRVNWAMLLQGAQGTGKTYFVSLLQAVLGTNVSNLDPEAIAGRFTGWAHGSTVCAVEEIRIGGANKYQILGKMKPFLTNSTISIEEKGKDHRTVPNFTNYLLLTNHADAIPLGEGDRRYCILYSHWQSESAMFDDLGGRVASAAYFDALFSDLRNSANTLAKLLKTRKISDRFNPDSRAPLTKSHQSMLELAHSPERQQIEDALEKHACEIISDQVLDLTHLNVLCRVDGEELPQARITTSVLLELGFRRIEKSRIKVSGSLHYVWTKSGKSRDDVRNVIKNYLEVDVNVPF